jgi:hypothetical protein
MALPREESVYRTVVELTGTKRLDEELGEFGRGVGPRFDRLTGQSRLRARGGECEDWCLRRLLIALVARDRLRMPATLCVSDPETARALPDAVLEAADGEPVGIEVTEATSRTYQRDLSAADRDAAQQGKSLYVLDPGDGHAGDGPERQAVQEIREAYDHKVGKLRAGNYAESQTVDLLIYLNSSADVFVDAADMAQRIRTAGLLDGKVGQFRQLHVLIGDTMILDALGNGGDMVSLYGRYEHDFNQWCLDQAQAARDGAVDCLDIDNIAEELWSLGASDRRALESQIKRVLEHLLKWTYQPDKRSWSWLTSMNVARDKIDLLLDDSPSLARDDVIRKMIGSSYSKAVKSAALETGLKRERFPEACPFTVEQIFASDFPPEDEYPERDQ